MRRIQTEEAAQELFNAERFRTAIAPLTERDPSFDAEAAYKVQLANVRRILDMGHKISGWKIGLTSLAMQKQLGVREPDYGHLFAAMECRDSCVESEALIQPKIEGELAFVLKKDLPGGMVTAGDVDEATEYIVAALEIVDSRIADWRIKLPDTIADNASSGRYVLGQTRIPPGSIDLASVVLKLFKSSLYESLRDERPLFTSSLDESSPHKGEEMGETLVSEGVGSAVLGDPRNAVAWLANKLWSCGSTLKAGEIVLSGAFSMAPAASKGDVFRAEFSDFGTVEAGFI
jgi:2-keto-4-pentenoate hydratase